MVITEKKNVQCQDIPRPKQELIDRYLRHDVAKLSDSMGRYGTLRHEVKPLSDSMRICGPAITVNCRPGDISGVLLAAEAAQAGDVIVVNAEGMTDLMAADREVYRKLSGIGVAGLVVDGAVGDKSEAVKLGFPVFSVGTTQRRLHKQDAAEINTPIGCAGMVVYPGDLVVGDSDGVVVIPGYDLERVAGLADAKLAKELYNRGQLETGLSPRQYYKFEEKMNKWREPEDAR